MCMCIFTLERAHRGGDSARSIYATSASHMVGQPVCARAITRTHTHPLSN